MTTCDLSYYEYMDEYNRNSGGNSHYVDDSPIEHAIQIFSLYDVKTIEMAFERWPQFGLCKHIRCAGDPGECIFKEYHYLRRRKVLVSEHKALIIGCLRGSLPSDILRVICDFAGAPAHLPLEMLSHNDPRGLKGYFSSAGRHAECNSIAYRDFLRSEYVSRSNDDHYSRYDFPCIALEIGAFFTAWDDLVDKDSWEGWEDIISRNHDYRLFLAALLGGMGFEFAEEAFASYPFLKDDNDLIEEYIEEACVAYYKSGKDFSEETDSSASRPDNWYKIHKSRNDNVIRRRLRRWPELISTPEVRDHFVNLKNSSP